MPEIPNPTFGCNLPRRVAHIILCVAEESGIPVEQILSKSVRHPVIAARHLAIHRLCALRDPTPSKARVSRWLGIHHTTVLDALKKTPVIHRAPASVDNPPFCIDQDARRETVAA